MEHRRIAKKMTLWQASIAFRDEMVDMDTETNKKKLRTHKFTARLPMDFYYQLSRIKEDFLRKETRVSTNDIFAEALNDYFKKCGYPEIK